MDQQKVFIGLLVSLWVVLILCTKVLGFVPPQWIMIDGVSNHREREVVSSWIAEVQEIVTSESFQNNLNSLNQAYPSVYLRNDTIGTVSELADIISLRSPDLRVVETAMAVVGGIDCDDAFGGWTGDPLGEGDTSTSLTLGRAHLKRYFSKNTVEKSCAINTLAHEWSHLIVTDPKQILHALTDTGATAPSTPVSAVGSYLVGTTAQCTWLDQIGRLAPTTLEECVRIFGTLNFNSLRCDQFPNSEPINLNRDLPPPAKPSFLN